MREKIKLESSAGTGHFYTTTKNKRTTPDKMEVKKFDPVARTRDRIFVFDLVLDVFVQGFHTGAVRIIRTQDIVISM